MDREIKNVLILCDAFPPAFNPRMGYLCKYLPELGWNPIVITEYTPQNIYQNLSENINITYINYFWSKNKFFRKLKYIYVFIADLIFNYKNHVIRKKAEEQVKKQKISIILSSTFRVYPTAAAYQLSNKYNIPFIMDLRDIFEQSANNELISKKITNYKWINNIVANIITKKLTLQRNKILKKANIATTVSTWHAETLSVYNPNVKLIYNGYDPELFYPEKIKNDKFIITYTGRLHSKELRNPTLLFDAVNQLFSEKKIDLENFGIHFYLMDQVSKEIILSLAQKHSITNHITCFDTIPSTEVPLVLNKSSILLLLANNATGEKSPKGIMGTKIFEYLAVEKPILCVRNDEACLQETINNANAGLAASTVDETAKFILDKYGEWEKKKFTHQQINHDYIQNFSRKKQAKQFEELFEYLLS